MKSKSRTSTVAITTTAACLFATTSSQIASAQRKGGRPQTERRAAAIPLPSGEGRSAIDAPRPEGETSRRAPGSPPSGGEPTFEFPIESRRIDGYGNNESSPEWGMSSAHYTRRVPAAYADGVSEPSGAHRPSARAVSNAVAAQTGPRPNSAGASDFVWQWGQFVDHDLDETPAVSPAEAFDIAVPAGDPFFDPGSSGTATIGLNRSDHRSVDGVRQQLNEITAYIDGSNVYGSDEERAFVLRLRDGSGRLATSEGDLLPFNSTGLANAPSSLDPSFFLAGDVRANEQAGLTALHTIFVREHNHWAATMREANQRMSGEEIYQAARAMVAAE